MNILKDLADLELSVTAFREGFYQTANANFKKRILKDLDRDCRKVLDSLELLTTTHEEDLS